VPPILDHHLNICGGCHGKLFVYTFPTHHVCVLLDNAPAPLRSLLSWTNTVFDELEFVEFVEAISVMLGDVVE